MIHDIPFISVQIIAMVCYLFLAIALLSAQKNKQIRSFIWLLLCFVGWTMGSLFMRLEIMPSYEFWYRVSVLALFFAPFLVYNFLFHFVDAKDYFHRWIWLGLTCIILFFTCFDTFLAPPQMSMLENGKKIFTYSVNWKVVIPNIVIIATLIDGARMTFRSIKNQDISMTSILPIFIGLPILIIGNLVSIIPGNIFPWDTLAGIINAILMFYALYRKRLFAMTLLVSRSVVVMETVLIIAPLAARFIHPVESIIEKMFPQAEEYITIIFALVFTAAIMTAYQILSKVMENLFLKDEQIQGERLTDMSKAVSKSLNLQEILEILVDTIKKTVLVDKVYVCLLDEKKTKYVAECAATPLDAKSFYIMADNPCIEWLKIHNRCMMIKEFERSSLYRSMWETEKKTLRSLKTACMLPLMCDGDLVGVVLLSEKRKNTNFDFDDISFLESAQSIISVAVKNAKLYQQAAKEARTDHLTDLLNRKTFMEALDLEYQRCKNTSLALIIFNLDDFKLFNQLYGAKEGDLALQRMARIIKNTVAANGTACRYGGKEFAVFLPNCDMRQAVQLAENIKQQTKSVSEGSENIMLKPLTFSCGICVTPYSATTLRELIENTDMAVYNAKRSGKNKVLAYTMDADGKGDKERDYGKTINNYEEYASTIYALTAAIDAKDRYTFNHSQNVAKYASVLAKAAGLNEEHVRVIYEAALLHDIGKIAIPESILGKPGRLTDEEYEIMKTHVEHSISIVRHLPSLDYVIPSAIGHHERWDGRGYPRGIAGEDIPIGARCLALADSFDAMTSKRSYKNACSVEYAVEEIKKNEGRQFDPYLSEIFIKLIETGGIKVAAQQPE